MDRFGRTALHVAAGCSKAKVVELLLQHPDIDVNVKNNEDYTPLFCAIDAGRRARGKYAILGRLIRTKGVNFNHD